MARRTQINILVALVSIAVLAAPAYAIINNKKQGEAKAEATFRSAAPAAAGFIDQFLKLRENSQRQLAAQYLGGPLVDIPNFDELANVFGFTSGSITDPQGNIVITYPVGVSIPGTSVHQLPAARAAAMAGGFVVSNLTTHPSAGGTSIPSIEISSSYTTWNNSIRVLTGAYSIAETPIGDFLSHLDSGGLVFLIDGQGQVISASPDKIPTASVVALSSLHRSLASAITRGAGGFYDTSNGNSNYFVAHDVSGTSWKLVMVESRDLLFQGTGTSKGSFIQWLAFAGFVAAVLVALVIFYRYRAERDKLAALSVSLDRVSRLDALTGLYNRRHVDDHLAATVALTKRHHSDLSILMADIDHFKRVNDTYGHEAGDVVLVEIALRLNECLRPEDTIGRWGGEEFLAVLPMTDATGAGEVAERIRYSVSASPIRIPSGDYLEITTSVGYSSASGHSADADRLIREADGALYKAKNGGRNRVVAAGPSVIDQPADRLAEKGGSN